MIKVENVNANVIEVKVPPTLKTNDFELITPSVDALIQQHGKIKLLVDASEFNGWDTLAAFEEHMKFAKNHHQKIACIAIIPGHMWHHWVITLIKMFVHPKIKTFDKNEKTEALQWLGCNS